jgi:hypothetical protein
MFNRRRHDRYAAQVPCIVQAQGITFHSTTVDLSLGGLRISLPSLSKVFLTSPVQSVQLDGLPPLRVKVRWTNQNQLGAEFTEPQYAQPRIRKLIEELHLHSDAELEEEAISAAE